MAVHKNSTTGHLFLTLTNRVHRLAARCIHPCREGGPRGDGCGRLSEGPLEPWRRGGTKQRGGHCACSGTGGCRRYRFESAGRAQRPQSWSHPSSLAHVAATAAHTSSRSVQHCSACKFSNAVAAQCYNRCLNAPAAVVTIHGLLWTSSAAWELCALALLDLLTSQEMACYMHMDKAMRRQLHPCF